LASTDLIVWAHLSEHGGCNFGLWAQHIERRSPFMSTLLGALRGRPLSGVAATAKVERINANNRN
jgi:hypothetical protein